MEYETLLQLIDLELGRLQGARALLIDSTPSQSQTTNRRAEHVPGMEQDVVALTPEPPLTAEPAAPVRKRAPRQASSMRRLKSRAPEEPRALSRHIPLGPVVIAPGALTHPRPASHAHGNPEAKRDTVPAEGTLEALVRDLRERGL